VYGVFGSGSDPVLSDSIDEADVADEICDELVASEASPVGLGGLAELEDPGEHGASVQAVAGPGGVKPDGTEGGLDRVDGSRWTQCLAGKP